MNATARETSDRYERVDSNVLRMKPIGSRTRPRILTPFGRVVVLTAVLFLASCALGIYSLLK